MSSSSMSLMYNQGSINARSGNYREAIHRFEQVLEKNPQNASAWRSRGFAFLLLGKAYFPDALESFREALNVSTIEPPYVLDYIAQLERCLELEQATVTSSDLDSAASPINSSCALNNLSRDRVMPLFTTVFPYLPVYGCREYPVLEMTKTDSE